MSTPATAIAHLTVETVAIDDIGPLIPLLTSVDDASRLLLERHVCIDTTAAGGNATLMSQAG